MNEKTPAKTEVKEINNNNNSNKAAMKLYYNPDPSKEAVRLFEEKSVRGGWHSVIIRM